MIKNMLNKVGFVRIALMASVGIPFILASNAFAQNPPPPPPPGAAPAPAAEVERVIVTGSNIPTAEEVGPNPVFSLNRDLINKSGAGTTTEQLLQRLPVVNGTNIPVNNNGTSQSGPSGTAAIGLRGLDPGATLVLVDGRRVAPFPGSALSGYGFVDLTTIPITAVQSIEILKDGASTTYGSDAVAGVVNFKLYKDYRGAQVTIQYGNSATNNGINGNGTDDAEYRGDILFGTGVSREGDVLDLAVEHGIVEKAGAWFSYGGERIGQGREKARDWLRERPKAVDEMGRKVLDLLLPKGDAPVAAKPAAAAA